MFYVAVIILSALSTGLLQLVVLLISIISKAVANMHTLVYIHFDV